MAAERTVEARPRRHGPVSSDSPGHVLVAALTRTGLVEDEGDEHVADLPGILDDPSACVWVDVLDPSLDQVQAIGSALQLHPLIVEDILEGNQRAKVEATNGAIHMILFALSHEQRFSASEIDLVLGKGFLLTVHDAGWDPRATHHMRTGLASIMDRGADHLLWALCDDIVDGYFPFADVLGDEIDRVQDAIISNPSRESLQELFAIKRQLIEVRRAAAPTREVFSQLTNRDLALIDGEEIVYFRDVYDHVIRLTDEMDSYREMASSTLEVYLTQINNQLSVIMKRLTGVTVILAGIGAVAGLFGMSEATVEAGNFWLVTGIIIGLAALAAVVLRRIDWL